MSKKELGSLEEQVNASESTFNFDTRSPDQIPLGETIGRGGQPRYCRAAMLPDCKRKEGKIGVVLSLCRTVRGDLRGPLPADADATALSRSLARSA